MYKLLQPNGKLVNVYYRRTNDRVRILEDVFLPQWEQFCLDNWLNNSGSNEFWSAESRVKRFLDSCGWFLLHTETKGLITEYKEALHKQKSIPLSSCGQDVVDYFYAGGATLDHISDADDSYSTYESDERDVGSDTAVTTKAKPREMTRMEKLNTVKDLYPNCVMSSSRVDTDGVFYHNGEKYIVKDKRYDPIQTKDGIYYSMDRIMAVTTPTGGMMFFTQSIDPIGVSDVTKI